MSEVNNFFAPTKEKEHWVYEVIDASKREAIFKYKVPYDEKDGDHGLPSSFFKNERMIHFEVTADKIEWCPAMGPAPCWLVNRAFDNEAEMLNAFFAWFEATY